MTLRTRMMLAFAGLTTLIVLLGLGLFFFNFQDQASGKEGQLVTMSLMVLVVSLVLSGILGWFLGGMIAHPIEQLIRRADRLAQGELETSSYWQEAGKDEIGRLTGAFDQISDYMRETARTAEKLSGGDFNVQVKPKSEGDAQGHAFVQMVAYLREMAEISQKLASGNLSVAVDPKSEKDTLGQAFNQMIAYQQEMADAFSSLAQGDLTVRFASKSPQDVMGKAFGKMTAQLHGLASQLKTDARQLGDESAHLSGSSGHSKQAISQISATIQQVALGAGHQAAAISETAASVDSMRRAMEGISKGAGHQAVALGEAINSMGQLSKAIEQVSQGASEQATQMDQAGQARTHMNQSLKQVTQTADQLTHEAQATDKSARDGIGIATTAANGVSQVRQTTADLSSKVDYLSKQSAEIGKIIETISEIAAQTNLLALNAAIEAARAGSESSLTAEGMLDQHMITESRLVSRLLELMPNAPAQFWYQFVKWAGIDAVCITNADGVVTIASEEPLLGFRFSDKTGEQTFEFRQLITKKDGVLAQHSQMRSFDKQVWKYAGVSRLDQPGIVQMGYNMDSLSRFKMQADGFGVIAAQVRELAVRTAKATKEIAVMVRSVQSGAGEAVVTMKRVTDDVNNAAEAMEQARLAFTGIAEGTQSSAQRVLAIGQAVQAMQVTAGQMEKALTQADLIGNRNRQTAETMNQLRQNLMEKLTTTSAVVDENAASTEDMTDGFSKLTHAMDNIASIGEENAASVEQVSASTEEIEAQVAEMTKLAKQLASMAEDLNHLVQVFNL